MIQNIKNNNTRSIKSRLYNANYFDFMLYKGNTLKYNKSYVNNMSIVDFSSFNIKDGILYSDVIWDGSVNEGVELNNIGFTGMDNGLISFRKDRITNEKFLELFLNSKYNIDSDEKRFFMTPITGNTQNYKYPMYLNTDEETYLSFKGGFYQGFFKLYGHKYQVLPDKLDNDITLHFEIRPRNDYEIEENTINYTHKNNKGIFFFIGTRAENKFWPYYNVNKVLIENFKKINAQTEGYFSGCNDSGHTYNVMKNNVVFLENKWVKEEEKIEEVKDDYFAIGDTYIKFDDSFLDNTVLEVNKNKFITDCNACCMNYFKDGYFDNRCPEEDNNKFVEDKFIGKGVEIPVDFNFTDSEGRVHDKYGFIEIETDNKFLLFDRTPSGFTVDNWVEGTKVTLTSRKTWPNANYFLLMNRTETGYTVNNIESYNEKNSFDFNIFKDVRNNVFALRVKDDGSIGYRYGIKDCDSENYYSLVEEYSKEGLIKTNEWNNINIRFSLLSNNKMKILFYVNGYLVFISKDLEKFNFRELNDVAEKQETVPYNISLGGGSLGLLETILPNYYAISEYILPIERNFCGSFIGDIKSFKMYEGFIDYSSIKHYLS